ncbi:MAG TPA: 3-oxoacyl-ACP synthase [Chryseosolibacter sp.]
MMPAIKHKLYDLCQEYIRKRVESARQAIEEAQQSANQETKSSSGDKYETGRAMMQLEIEKNAQQLSESLKLKHALDQIHIERASTSVQPGSLVVTDREVFFIAISLGKVTVDGKGYVVISPASPLGLVLLGSKPGDRLVFRDQTYVVQELI